MRNTAAAFIMVGLTAVPLAAQGPFGRYDNRGVPPGQMPPPGACRIWYDGRPPGQQPPPMSCREAERIASRTRSARVIYGASPNSRNDPRWGRYPDGRGYGYQNVAFDNGYRDGYDKGREDVRDRDRYDPVRHGRYRSADHGYNKRYGPKEYYKDVYREGFLAGYDAAYREGGRYRTDRRWGIPGW